MESLISREFACCKILRCESRDSFETALKSEGVDLILADYSLPGFDGFAALELARMRCPEIPFIVVSGIIGEELAIECIHRGATDFVIKDKLSRLCPAIRRALRERNEREDRLRAQLALRESEERLNLALEAVRLGTFDFHVETGKMVISPIACQILGIAEQVIQGLAGLLRTAHPEDRQTITSKLREAIASDSVTEFRGDFRVLRDEGTIAWVHLHGRATTMTPSGQSRASSLSNRFLGTLQDITAARTAEQALRESEARLSGIIESAAEAILMVDQSGKVALLNPAARAMFEIGGNELPGQPIEEFLPQFLDIQIPRNLSTPGQGENTTPASTRLLKLWGIRKSGSKFPAEATLSQTEVGGHKLVTVVLRDVTERLAAEEERQQLEKQLRQAQKMEAIGTLAGGIAHDFNNILGAILGYTELARLDASDNPVVVESLDAVLKASHRAKDLVKQILAFSRQESSTRHPLQISSVIKETVKLLHAAIPRTIEIRADIRNELPAVKADPIQIQQVLMNLATNAAHAMKASGGILSVQLDLVRLDADSVKAHPALKPGNHVRLVVEDTGEGMDQRLLERIFEPFFTTKAPGEGTGLGLSVALGIIQNHEGEIQAKSTPEKGTRFEILLPAAAQTEGSAGDGNTAGSAMGKGERILIVDDEIPLANMARRMLERMGYVVTVATEPEKALGLFRDSPDTFQVVLTDYAMPAMDGLKLTRAIKSTRNAIPVIMATGLGSHVNEESAREAGVNFFLAKPYTLNSLGEAILAACSST